VRRATIAARLRPALLLLSADRAGPWLLKRGTCPVQRRGLVPPLEPVTLLQDLPALADALIAPAAPAGNSSVPANRARAGKRAGGGSAQGGGQGVQRQAQGQEQADEEVVRGLGRRLQVLRRAGAVGRGWDRVGCSPAARGALRASQRRGQETCCSARSPLAVSIS
jgi:hypothetical protein